MCPTEKASEGEDWRQRLSILFLRQRYPRLLSAAVINTRTKRNLGRKGCTGLALLGNLQSLREVRHELKQAQRQGPGGMLHSACPFAASWLFHTCLRNSLSTVGWALLHQSIIDFPTDMTEANLIKTSLQLRFPLPM